VSLWGLSFMTMIEISSGLRLACRGNQPHERVRSTFSCDERFGVINSRMLLYELLYYDTRVCASYHHCFLLLH
jgi:hypothetical protein